MAAALIEGIRHEHRDLQQLLDALERQIDVFEEGGSPDYDVIIGVADYFLEYPNRCHHPKEDLIYAALRQGHAVEAAEIGDLGREHGSVRERAKQFRETMSALLSDAEIARSVIVTAARLFIEAERRHMAEEEERFLPTADRLLTASEWRTIEQSLSMLQSSNPTDKLEQKFKTLCERLLAWERG